MYANRTKLLDERTALQGQLDELYNRKRESAARYKEANDKFYVKLNEDRARRAERLRAQREEQEAAKKKELVDRLREEADVPAYQAQIEDCQTLIDYFSGKSSVPAKLSIEREDRKAGGAVAGVPQLEIRKVEAGPAEGMVVLKNEQGVLPVKPGKVKKVALIGPNMKDRVISGGGSAALKPSFFITPYDGLVSALGQVDPNVEITYSEGASSECDRDFVQSAAAH